MCCVHWVHALPRLLLCVKYVRAAGSGQEMPQLVEGGEEEPAVEEPVEEEFDLADVLGEEVGGSGSKEELLRKAEQELEASAVISTI